VPEEGERMDKTGIRSDTNFATAASPALEASVTTSKNTTPNTRTKDSNRFLGCPAMNFTRQLALFASSQRIWRLRTMFW
jgi:hypothetical protein